MLLSPFAVYSLDISYMRFSVSRAIPGLLMAGVLLFGMGSCMTRDIRSSQAQGVVRKL